MPAKKYVFTRQRSAAQKLQEFMPDKLNSILILAAATVIYIGVISVHSESSTQHGPPWPIENRRYYKTREDLLKDWSDHQAAISTNEGKNNAAAFLIICSAPYSGVNAMDVFVYISSGGNWRLYTVVFLPKSAQTTSDQFKIDVKQADDHVDLFHKGALFATLKLN